MWNGNEQLLSAAWDAQADVYSFGAILFEMVMQQNADSRKEGVKPLVPQQCSQEVSDLIFACTQRYPDLRPTSKDVFEKLSSLVSQS